jgi:hypothetical protein
MSQVELPLGPHICAWIIPLLLAISEILSVDMTGVMRGIEKPDLSKRKKYHLKHKRRSCWYQEPLTKRSHTRRAGAPPPISSHRCARANLSNLEIEVIRSGEGYGVWLGKRVQQHISRQAKEVAQDNSFQSGLFIRREKQQLTANIQNVPRPGIPSPWLSLLPVAPLPHQIPASGRS